MTSNERGNYSIGFVQGSEYGSEGTMWKHTSLALCDSKKVWLIMANETDDITDNRGKFTYMNSEWFKEVSTINDIQKSELLKIVENGDEKLPENIVNLIKEAYEKKFDVVVDNVEAPEKPKILDELKFEISDEDRASLVEKMKKMVDKKTIKKILAGSEQVSFGKVKGLDKIIDLWANSKVEMFKLFDEQFTLTKEIDLKIDKKEMANLVNELQHKYPQYALILNCFNPEEFIENELKYSNHDIYNYINFQKGMKLSKFFSNLTKDEQFNIDLSKVLQQKTVKGYITYSIDPIDILFMSVNKNDWRSCHNVKTGEYKAGCLAYVCDTSTFIVYKHNGKEYEYSINNYKVKSNSKSWRSVAHYDCNTQAMTFAKGYPYHDKNLNKTSRQLIEDHIAEKFGVENIWKKFKIDYNFKCRHIDFDNSLFYNDIEHDNGTSYAVWLKNINKEKIKIYVGDNQAPCVVCGEKDISGSGQLSCWGCK